MAGGAWGKRVKCVLGRGTLCAKARRQHDVFEELKVMQWSKGTVAPAQAGEEERQEPQGP